jgi:hypothetical protein
MLCQVCQIRNASEYEIEDKKIWLCFLCFRDMLEQGKKPKPVVISREEQEKRREMETEEKSERSIFEESEPKKRGLLTHPSNPLSDRDPHFKSLTIHQVEKIEECCREGLSIRSIKKAMHVFENIDISFGTIQEIRKKMKEKEWGVAPHQSS